MAILLRYESRRKPEVPVFLTNTVVEQAASQVIVIIVNGTVILASSY